MSYRLTALALLGAFGVASGSATAATMHHKMAMAHGKMAMEHKGSSAPADNSADSLNATSLADAKSNTPYAPPATPVAAKPAPHGKKTMTKKS